MSPMSGNADFDTYRLSEDHEAIREAVRAVAEDKIAPYAAAVDEDARYPQEAHDALVASDFFAPHVARGVRRGRRRRARGLHRHRGGRAGLRVVLAHPGGQQAGLAAARHRRERGGQDALPHAARGGGVDVLLRAVRARGRFRHRRDEEPSGARRRRLGAHRAEVVDHQRRCLRVLHGPRGHRPRRPARQQHHGVRRREVRRGVHLRREGAQARHQGSPTRELHFDNVRLPGDRVVGEVGAGLKIALATLDHTRVTIGAQAVGIAQGALDHAVAYVKERQQFGKRVADFQGVQFMLADMAMELEAARQMVYVAAAKSERGDADLPFFGAAAKCYASDVAMKVTTDAVQLLGGAGYTRDFPLERMMRDAKITQIYEGTNQVQRIVMARQLLKR